MDTSVHYGTLKYPVISLEKKEILPAGVQLTPKVLRHIGELGQKISKKTYPLFEYHTVRHDLTEFLQHDPYHRIFSQSNRRERIFSIISKVKVIQPVIDCLDYFKEYDFGTYRHMLLVFALSTLLGQELMCSRSQLHKEAMASPSHDFGKVSIPLKILTKKELLTFSERKMLEHHALAGFALMHYYSAFSSPLAAKIARDHHERKNGSGYPRGISLRNQMIEIVVVSDIYDALISPRPYRPVSYDNRAALEELCTQADQGKFSPAVVRALIAINRKKYVGEKGLTYLEISRETRGAPPKNNLYGKFIKD